MEAASQASGDNFLGLLTNILGALTLGVVGRTRFLPFSSALVLVPL